MSSDNRRVNHDKPRHTRTRAKKGGFFYKLKTGFLSMSVLKRTVVISLIAVILALVIAISWVIGMIAGFKQDYNHQEVDDPEIQEIQPIDDQIINIALFGIDSRKQNFSGLSDSIMVLSINTGTGDIKLFSIMRDTLVKMPDYKGKSYKPNKINSAYSRGGASYAIKTINENFGLDIKEYATVNFFGMAEIIDAVGGVEIEVLEREINAKNGLNANIKEQANKLGIKNPKYVEKAGKQLLTGIQAVAWARIRSVSTGEGTANDYGRTDRQRVVMEQLLNKVLSIEISKYPGLIKAILPNMQTSLSFSEAVSLATHVLGKKVNFEQTRVPQAKYVINDNFYVSYAGSSVYYDLGYASKLIHAMIYDGISQDEYMNTNGIEKNKWYTGSSGSSSSSNKNDKDEEKEDTNNTPENSDTPNQDNTGDGETPDQTTPENPDQNTPENSDQNTTPNENENQGDGGEQNGGGEEDNGGSSTETETPNDTETSTT